MANATKLRWIAALAGAALIATVAYAALRLGSSPVAEAHAPIEPEAKPPGARFEVHAPPGLEESIAAAAAVAEDTPEGQLVLAAREGRVERVRELLAQGIPPDAPESKNGHRALHQAAEAGQREVVELLLAHGADPTGRDGNGHTPLMWAAQAASVEVGERLLDAGAEVNDRSDTGETPLTQLVGGSFHRQIQGSAAGAPGPEAELEFARMLFDRGADPNLYSETGSPLKVLAVAQNAALLELFVENGARTDGDPELAMLGMMPGPVGQALQAASAPRTEPHPANESR